MLPLNQKDTNPVQAGIINNKKNKIPNKNSFKKNKNFVLDNKLYNLLGI